MNLVVWMEGAQEYARPHHYAVWRTTYYERTLETLVWMSAVETTEVDGALLTTTYGIATAKVTSPS